MGEMTGSLFNASFKMGRSETSLFLKGRNAMCSREVTIRMGPK
jgi:hypothetical protein